MDVESLDHIFACLAEWSRIRLKDVVLNYDLHGIDLSSTAYAGQIFPLTPHSGMPVMKLPITIDAAPKLPLMPSASTASRSGASTA